MLARHAHFVLVPGPNDPCLGAAGQLPRTKLPSTLCPDLLETLAHCTLATSAYESEPSRALLVDFARVLNSVTSRNRESAGLRHVWCYVGKSS